MHNACVCVCVYVRMVGITWLKELGVQDEQSLKELLQKTIFRHFANDPSEVANCLTE